MSTRIDTGVTEGLDCDRTVAIPIEVNTHRVIVQKRRMTGTEIKAAAIAAGVKIQPTFTLMLKRRGSPSVVIGDNEVVVMEAGQRFSCLPADDNS